MSEKAIPTEYAGYLFRSRLEARWAVFFDKYFIDKLFNYIINCLIASFSQS